MSSIRKPQPLPPGGAIGVVSPSSPIDSAALECGVAVLQSRGFRVVVAPHALDRHGHLAGRDEDRAADLAAFYASPEIDVLWCSRGGSSSCRLWPHLDWDALAALPPKMLVGFSDITSLHIPFNQRLGVVSLHGPMIVHLPTEDEAALDWQLALLQSAEPLREVPGRVTDTLVPGVAEGALCGGCLSLIAGTAGTPCQIDAPGKLLLMEDVGESPWHIERYLVQLREAGVLAQASGFIIGEATDADDSETLPMRQIWAELLEPFGKPTVLGFPFGHVVGNIALPLGVPARLNAAAGTLTLLESAVESRELPPESA